MKPIIVSCGCNSTRHFVPENAGQNRQGSERISPDADVPPILNSPNYHISASMEVSLDRGSSPRRTKWCSLVSPIASLIVLSVSR